MLLLSVYLLVSLASAKHYGEYDRKQIKLDNKLKSTEKKKWNSKSHLFFQHIDVFPLAAQSKNRVEIQVYRGANNEKEDYAQWGFLVRQPSSGLHHNSNQSIQPIDKSDSMSNNLPDPR